MMHWVTGTVPVPGALLHLPGMMVLHVDKRPENLDFSINGRLITIPVSMTGVWNIKYQRII
jgi:hypothetical protein